MSSSFLAHEVAGPQASAPPVQPLLTPFRMGDLSLRNRVVMAPLTRMRARPDNHVPSALQAEYYAQRARAGLIVTEATAISPEGFGWADTPGLWSKEQVRGWRLVTDAVHNAGGRIVAQLWHTGAMSHPELRDGVLPVSASDVDPGQVSVTRDGRKPTVAPRPLTREEIRTTTRDYAQRRAQCGRCRIRRSSDSGQLSLPDRAVPQCHYQSPDRRVWRLHREPRTLFI